ncbi:MAG: TlpA disulfide reductase family protein, partial [Myxococcota bacterium]
SECPVCCAPRGPMSAPEHESRWRRFRSSRAGQWSVDIAIVLAVFTGVSLYQTRGHLGSSDVAPTTHLRTLAHGSLDLEDMRGKPTVVVFWAPWCGVCAQEVSTINALARDRGDVHVLSVALGFEREREVQSFVDEYGVEYPVLLGDHSTQHDWHIDAFPTIYILDSEGRVRHSTVGTTTGFGLMWRLWRV